MCDFNDKANRTEYQTPHGVAKESSRPLNETSKQQLSLLSKKYGLKTLRCSFPPISHILKHLIKFP